ncbi:MAG TPA: hypothetical protein VGE37_04730, partial [Archangium sp.]
KLRVVKLISDGFERAETLLTVCVMKNGRVLEGHELWSAGWTVSSTPLGPNGAVLELDEAQQQVLFFAQAELDAAEHVRFEKASIQAERFVADRLLVLQKRRAVLDEKLELATQRRDGAAGSEAREDAEKTRTALQRQLDALDDELQKLERRDDARYQHHQAHIHRRRYTPPTLETLFELDLVFE